MGEQEPKQVKEYICAGLLAHVDAGKTTLAEALLYLTGSIRKAGRVDHKNAFLDTYALERDRGITIFSKQAQLVLGNKNVTLLDTPGHMDFSAEMERTLQVLDYAILIINGADGIRGHDETLWKLLERYAIPTFIFVNKMDQQGVVKETLMHQLRHRLSEHCIDFGVDHEDGAFLENVAMCDEQLLEQYLDRGVLTWEQLAWGIQGRKLFPCYFGSALKHTGVEDFLAGLDTYIQCPVYPDVFGAKIYKISRDDKGTRLTHMKITGGSLKVKTSLAQSGSFPEKVDQIRIYSGSGFKMTGEADAGMICTVAGPVKTYAGQCLGSAATVMEPVLTPVLTYEVILPQGCNVHEMLLNLRELCEEIPELRLEWQEEGQAIRAQIMGEVQLDVIKNMILERYGTAVEFGTGTIVYKETIEDVVEGVGHFEPLRHYAEVHLRMEPGMPGSGLVFDSECSEDLLDRNWQRLILTHLQEKGHRGVLTGALITDMHITLMSGRAHVKHTEGGDFRQATYRAVRQGLRQAKSVLLEPVYSFRLEVPTENVGRALADIQKLHGTFEPPQSSEDGAMALILGRGPVAAMKGYGMEVINYTKGRGQLFCTVDGYEPCHNAQEVIDAIGYAAEEDLENPTGSVFCAHGAGFNVPWDQVSAYMHLPSCLKKERPPEKAGASKAIAKERIVSSKAGERELEEIFIRTYGPIKRERGGQPVRYKAEPKLQAQAPPAKAFRAAEYLLVDGYNIIFAWDELKALAQENLDSARMKLADILCDYQGYKKPTVILVFDAYKVEGHPGTVEKYKNIYIVYTKEAETADQYIEKTVHKIGRSHQVTVATSDRLEQVIILGQGAHRMSAEGLRQVINEAKAELRENYLKRHEKGGQYLMENIPEDMAQHMEAVRLGFKVFGKEYAGDEEL